MSLFDTAYLLAASILVAIAVTGIIALHTDDVDDDEIPVIFVGVFVVEWFILGIIIGWYLS